MLDEGVLAGTEVEAGMVVVVVVVVEGGTGGIQPWEPLMYAAHMQMSKAGLPMNRNGPHGMGRPPPLPMMSLATSLIQRPPPLMSHNPGFPRMTLRNNTPELPRWSTGVLPMGAGAILNQFVQQSQPMPRGEDLRSALKRRSDPPNVSPPKQMRVAQPPPPPMNNQQAAARKKLNNAMSRQRGGPVKKGPIASRLSMPPTNPNLTTIKTVDIGHMTKQKLDGRPQQNNNQPQNQDNQANRGFQQQQQQRQQQQQQQQQKQQQQQQDSKQPGMPKRNQQ
ncbi:hypothetical protein GWK47_019153 [Chionoecetes opilio]|uniref:Uncharacterized protein n=1 Tax=Chionoecetes opilio TaxID=41210 RepID=A0A8J5CI97_CHIOP|nr:hypothetical protein GWK47_019153 [Chionoecetes opilio]